MKHFLCIVCLFAVSTSYGLQNSSMPSNGQEQLKSLSAPMALNTENPFRRTGIHDGNRIRSTYTNFGNLGSRASTIRGEWPKGSGITYIWESAFYVGAEVLDAHSHVIHIFSDSYAGSGSGRDKSPDDSHGYCWEPLPGFFNESPFNSNSFPAMSHLPETWPALWPNRAQEWAGKWIGEAGPWPIADQESYYLMDDRNNDEFDYYPFVGSQQDSLPWPQGRRGLGLEVQVRACQWNDPQLKDIWFTTYDIKNVSDKVLTKVVCGFYHDWDIGTEGSQPDTNDDDMWYDASINMVFQWDLDGRSVTGKPTGLITQKILQSPDNVGLTSFYGSSSGDVLSDDEDAWQVKTRPGTFCSPFLRDVTFIMGSGYFALQPGESKRYATAITMADDFQTLRRNSKMAQWFYDGGYSLAVHKVELLSPRGGETFTGYMNIKWKAESTTDSLLVDIFYSNDDWRTWRLIAENYENNGLFTMHIGRIKEWDGINYSVRVIVHNASGMGASQPSNHFTINYPGAAAPEIFLTSPQGGQTVHGVQDIRWRAGDADGDPVTVNLFCSPDSGHTWLLIAEKQINDGIFSWDTTPFANGSRYLLKAVVSDGDLQGTDIMEQCFRIANDHPSMKSSYVEHFVGSSNAQVGIHVIDPSALSDHTYELTFSLVDSTTYYHVYDLYTKSYLLYNELVTPYAEGKPFLGLRLWLHNYNEPTPMDSSTGWLVGDANLVLHVDKDPNTYFMAIPADFEIRVSGMNVDTCFSPVSAWQIPVDFQVWNITDSVKMEFLFTESGVADGRISDQDVITLVTNRSGRRFNTSWRIEFRKPVLQDPILPESGDVARVGIARPFTEADVYRFQSLPEYFVKVTDEIYSADSYCLLQNYPNPVNAGTTIEYALAKATQVRLQIFDVLGREVTLLVDGYQQQGAHRIYWPGCNNSRQPVANGLYVYRITAGDYVAVKKMVLLK